MSESAQPRLNREQVRAAKSRAMTLPDIEVEFRNGGRETVTVSVPTIAAWERHWERSHLDLTVQSEDWRMDWVLWLVWYEYHIGKENKPEYEMWLLSVFSIDWVVDEDEEDAPTEGDDGEEPNHPLDDGEEATSTESQT